VQVADPLAPPAGYGERPEEPGWVITDYCWSPGCPRPVYSVIWLADLQEHIIPATHCKEHHKIVTGMPNHVCAPCQAMMSNAWRRPDIRLKIVRIELIQGEDDHGREPDKG
jgi:hypothetical protein